MAAGRPVVSSALDEVKLNFGSVVRIARNHTEFIALCRRELDTPSRTRISRGLKLAADNSWEAIVAKLEHHVAETLTAKTGSHSAEIVNIVPLVRDQRAYV
jgi:hypothetical protein